MRHRKPTRSDVALRAGVAPSTVTLILSDKGTELRIPESTQKRVREAARSLGYYPNKHIKSVLSGRSGILGLYLRPDQYYSPIGYWPTVLNCIQRAAAEADVQLLIHNAPAHSSTEEIFARQAGGLVDGVMIINSGNDPIVGRILEAKLPAVEVGDPFSELPFVGLDAAQGIRLAMQHALDCGYRRPALVDWTSTFVENVHARLSEFSRCARELFSIDDPARLIFEVRTADEVFHQIMANDTKPDCVICTGDELAIQFLLHCEREGIDVPREIGLIGSDRLEILGTRRVLTTIESPLAEMAGLALKKLQDVVEGRPYEHGTLLSVGLRVGDTTRNKSSH